MFVDRVSLCLNRVGGIDVKEQELTSEIPESEVTDISCPPDHKASLEHSNTHRAALRLS